MAQARSKVCCKCKIEKLTEFFNKRKKAKDGLDFWCKECNRKACKRYQKSDIAQERQRKRSIERYGISTQQYEEFLTKQNGVCAICFEKEKHFARLVIDHDHQTGIVRGLLCNDCNRGLGLLKDKSSILLSAARYINGSS